MERSWSPQPVRRAQLAGAQRTPPLPLRLLRPILILTLVIAVAAIDLQGAIEARAAGWTTSRATSTALWGPTAVIRDGLGHHHLVTARRDGDHGLFYATDASGSWVRKRLMPISDVRWVNSVDIAIDSDRQPHIVYSLSRADDIRQAIGIWYATETGGSWTTRQLTNGSDTAPSIAISSGGRIHIAFDRFRSGIYHGSSATGHWSFARITTKDGAPDMAVDAGGKVHVAFSYIDLYTYYLTDSSGSWASRRLTASDGEEDGAALALDTLGRPRVLTGGQDGLVLYSLSSGTWKRSLVGASVAGDRPGALAIDGDGKSHVLIRSSSGVRYLTDRSGTWVGSIVSPVDGTPVALLLAGSGAPDAFWKAGSTYRSTRSGGGWTRKLVLQERVDHDPAVAIGPDGDLHIAFIRAQASHQVWYGRRHGASWTFSPVSATGPATAPEIAVDSSGHVRIVWQREVSGSTAVEIWLASNVAGSFVRTRLSSDGRSPSIAIDGTDHVHVVYGRGALGLRYVTDRSGGLVTRTVTSADDVATIAVTPGGVPHLGIRRGTSIRYAVLSGGVWKFTTIQSYPTLDTPEIALAGTGKVHLVYQGHYEPATGGQDPIHHATNAGGSWEVDTLPNPAPGYLAVDPDLVVDGSGRPVVVFATGETAVWRAVRTSAAWSTEKVYARTDYWPIWQDVSSPSIARRGSVQVIVFDDWGIRVSERL